LIPLSPRLRVPHWLSQYGAEFVDPQIQTLATDIMKNKSLVLLLLAIFSCFLVASSSVAQDKKPEVKLSEGETKALTAINALTDPAAKLKAIDDFIKKYPKTPIRVELANTVAEELVKIKDPAQLIPLAESAQNIFSTGRGEGSNRWHPARLLRSGRSRRRCISAWHRNDHQER
jgi:hypothetical protein